MTHGEEKVNRRRFRLSHLFAFTAFVALIIWFSQHVTFVVGYGKLFGTRPDMMFILKWDQHDIVNLRFQKE